MKNCFSHRCHVGIGPRTQLWLSVLVLALVIAGAGSAGFWYGQIRSGGDALGQFGAVTQPPLVLTKADDLLAIKVETSSELDALSLTQVERHLAIPHATAELCSGELAGESEHGFPINILFPHLRQQQWLLQRGNPICSRKIQYG